MYLQGRREWGKGVSYPRARSDEGVPRSLRMTFSVAIYDKSKK